MKITSKIKKIRQFIKRKYEEKDWKYHIIPVIKYAKKLAKRYKVNEEVLELAALLHDIGRIRMKDDRMHHITGIPKAEKILKKYDYPERVIKEVKHCIESHRGSTGIRPKTTIAKIIANADAMSHFDVLPIFFYWRNARDSFEGIVKWLDEKIERDWNKKLTLPEAKKLMEEKYKAIKLILNSTKKYL